MNRADLPLLKSTTPLQLYLTASYPCSYLANTQARSQVAIPARLINTARYSQLVREGFRRSGDFFYRPACESCKACESLRVLSNAFEPNRSQLRAWKRHKDLVATVTAPYFDAAHYALFTHYQSTQHAGGDMDNNDVLQYQQFLLQTNINSRLVAFHDGSGALKILSLIDLLDDGLSAVYTFYDTLDAQASYGTYAVLWLIDQAQQLDLPYTYLGFHIEGTHKMRYKANFKPHEVLRGQVWG